MHYMRAILKIMQTIFLITIIFQELFLYAMSNTLQFKMAYTRELMNTRAAFSSLQL
jgi:hypothetical protein